MIDAVLEHETDLVWESDPETVAYVRQRAYNCHTRTGDVHRGRVPGEVVGYATVDENAPTTASGLFRRRVFYLKETDRPRGGKVYEAGVPAEAVDPLTVEPGSVGNVTGRARGEA